MEHFEAIIRHGYVGQVQQVLEHWPLMATQVGPDGLTPLEVACENTTPQQAQKIVTLLNHGADVHQACALSRITNWTNSPTGFEDDPYGAVPLTATQWHSIALLWHAGARFYPCIAGSTPMHDALVRGDNHLFSQVLAEITSLPEHIQNECWVATNDDDATVVHEAVAFYPELVEHLLNVIPNAVLPRIVNARTIGLNTSPLDIVMFVSQRNENYPVGVLDALLDAGATPTLEQCCAILVADGV